MKNNCSRHKIHILKYKITNREQAFFYDTKSRIFLSLCDVNATVDNICFSENIRYREKTTGIYTLETLDIYTLPVRHIYSMHWIYIPNTSASYIQRIGK